MATPCTVGLTGGLASGKSSVAAVLASRGVPVFDADGAVHRLYESGGAGADAVAALFGPDMLAADGGVDRDRLGRRVLGDAGELSRLNESIHPLVRTEIGLWLRGLSEPVAVVEAALLIETGASRDYDVLVVVACDPEVQLARAIARGVPEERAVAILNAQAPMFQKVAAADVVINNSGSMQELEPEIDRAWSEVLGLCNSR